MQRKSMSRCSCVIVGPSSDGDTGPRTVWTMPFIALSAIVSSAFDSTSGDLP